MAVLVPYNRINLPNVMERKEAERAAPCVRDSPECGLWAQQAGEAVIPPGLTATACLSSAKGRLFPDSWGGKGRSRQLVELISKQECLLHEENPLLHTTPGAEHLQTPGCLLNVALGPSNSVPKAKTRSEFHEPNLRHKVSVLLWLAHRGTFPCYCMERSFTISSTRDTEQSYTTWRWKSQQI